MLRGVVKRWNLYGRCSVFDSRTGVAVIGAQRHRTRPGTTHPARYSADEPGRIYALANPRETEYPLRHADHAQGLVSQVPATAVGVVIRHGGINGLGTL